MGLRYITPLKVPAGFSPIGIPGCVLWLDGQDSSTITQSSGLVSEWADKSGQLNNFAQGVTANQPSVDAASINGNQSLLFTGANPSYMSRTPIPLSTNTAYTIYVVQQPVSTGLMVALCGANSDCTIPLTYIAGNLVELGDGDSSENFSDFNQSVTANVGHVYQLLSNTSPATSSVAVDGTSLTSAGFTGSTWDWPTIDVQMVGARSGSLSFPFDGNIGEIVVFNVLLTGPQQLQMQDYLRTKWGTP